jgi:hypothetical protein
MHALQVAAQFAAYTWYTGTKVEAKQEEATRFARTRWADFLPAAHEGLGQLLLKIAAPPKRRKSTRIQKTATLAC